MSNPRGHPASLVGKGFPPGVSGNPGGRPKYSAISDATRRFLDLKAQGKEPEPKTRAEELALSMIRRAKSKPRELELVLDRSEGKVSQTVTVEGGMADAFAQAAASLAEARGRR